MPAPMRSGRYFERAEPRKRPGAVPPRSGERRRYRRRCRRRRIDGRIPCGIRRRERPAEQGGVCDDQLGERRADRLEPLAEWRGSVIRLQLAASPEALAARDFQLVTLSMNDICLQSFARDLARTLNDRGYGLWPRFRWWLPRSESLLAIANALLGLVISAAAEILSLLTRGCRRLIVWRSRLKARMQHPASFARVQPLTARRRRRRSTDRPAEGVPAPEVASLS